MRFDIFLGVTIKINLQHTTDMIAEIKFSENI